LVAFVVIDLAAFCSGDDVPRIGVVVVLVVVVLFSIFIIVNNLEYVHLKLGYSCNNPCVIRTGESFPIIIRKGTFPPFATLVVTMLTSVTLPGPRHSIILDNKIVIARVTVSQVFSFSQSKKGCLPQINS
tara:strand:+ start:163 stop:552 length:390 start_codon:yes stop_codon:yes gene_type:complete